MDLNIVTSLPVLLPILAGLALIDSLSFGTLAIPVWLLMAPGRLRTGRVILYLATIGGFYFVVGLVLLFGAQLVTARLHIDWSHPLVMAAGFVIGLGLLVLSFVLELPKVLVTAQRATSRNGNTGVYARLASWRATAVGEPPAAQPAASVYTTTVVQRGRVSLMTIALTAGALEVATMLPYLASIGLLTASAPALELSPAHSAGLLAAYCVVMLLPALVLLSGRILLRSLITPVLNALDAWFARNGQSTIAWIVGIVSVVLMLNAWPAVQQLLTG